MRELAPTPEVTFDVADMPEAPPDGRPLLFVGPPPGGRPIVGGRPGTSAAPRAETADARVAQYSPTPSPLRPGTTASRRRAQTSSPTWYGDAREGEAKRLIRIKATTRGGSRRRAARVSKVRANMRANGVEPARLVEEGGGPGQFSRESHVALNPPPPARRGPALREGVRAAPPPRTVPPRAVARSA